MKAQLVHWLDWIVKEHHRHRPTGLDRAELLAHRIQLTTPAAKSVVVGGTNGKGSTVHYLERILLNRGLKVGATTSPHFEQYNERIRVNGIPVPDDDILHSFETIENERNDVPLTYFEWSTLAALDIFKRAKIERAVLEVGLGGRLDTTNIVDRDVSVITNVGMDHSDVLGPDLESIAYEKAGILQAGVPLIYGDEVALDSVLNRAESLDCPIYIMNREFGLTKVPGATWSCWITVDGEATNLSFESIPSIPNSAVMACQAAAILEGNVEQTTSLDLQECALPGRMELLRFRNREWLLDVGHNPDAAQFIAKQLERLYPGRDVSLLFSCNENKDALGILNALNFAENRITVTSTHRHRGQSAETLAQKLYPMYARVEPDLEVALDYLVGSTQPHDLILVVGSFELVSRVRSVITIGIGRRG